MSRAVPPRVPTRARRRERLLLLCAAGLALATALASARWRTPTGLIEDVHSEPGLAGSRVRARVAPAVDLGAIRGGGLPHQDFSVRWRGYWVVDRGGAYDILLGADDTARLTIDGRLVHERSEALGFGTTPRTVTLDAGPHPIEIVYEQFAGARSLNVLVAPAGSAPAPLPRDALFPSKPRARDLLVNDALAWAWRLAFLLAVAAAGAHVARQWSDTLRASRARGEGWRQAAGTLASSAAQVLARPAIRGAALAVIALAVALWAAVLRLDAVSGRYGPVETPGWASAVERAVRDVAPYLRPEHEWTPVPEPYVGGDPVNYLRFAREMQGFYQAHVREPVFLAATRSVLFLLGGQDIAVSVASALFGVLLVAATFLLGLQAGGVTAAVVASLALAGDFTAISWSADGWRDEAAALFVVLTASSLLALRDRPTLARGMAFGVVGGLATLTRITLFLVWVPAGALAVVTGCGEWRARLRAGLVGFALATAVAAPYVVNCAREFGDPLHAVNAHTGFYRAREQSAPPVRESAVGYALAKLRQEPARTLDTLLYGLTVYPFTNKWTGLGPWSPALPGLLRWAAIAGLWLLTLDPRGRAVLLVLVLALVPFALTWNIVGGAEWRFTLAAYPFYLAAAGVAIRVLASVAARSVAGRPLRAREAFRHHRVAILVSLAVAIVVASGLWLLPWIALRQRLAAGRTIAIVPGTREAIVFTTGFMKDTEARCLPLQHERARVALPLPPGQRAFVRLHLQHPGPADATEVRVHVSTGPVPLGGAVLSSEERNRALDVSVAERMVGRWTTPLDLQVVASGSSTLTVPPRLCSVTVSREPQPGS